MVYLLFIKKIFTKKYIRLYIPIILIIQTKSMWTNYKFPHSFTFVEKVQHCNHMSWLSSISIIGLIGGMIDILILVVTSIKQPCIRRGFLMRLLLLLFLRRPPLEAIKMMVPQEGSFSLLEAIKCWILKRNHCLS